LNDNEKLLVGGENVKAEMVFVGDLGTRFPGFARDQASTIFSKLDMDIRNGQLHIKYTPDTG